MKKRSQINEKYKWDLSKFCKSDKEWYERLEELKALATEVDKFKGKLNDPKTLLKFYNLNEKYYMLSSKLNMYASNNLNCNLSNSNYVEMENIIGAVDNDYGVKTSFYAPEMLSYSEDYLKSLINDKKFSLHHFGLSKLLRNKPHILSEKEEKLLSASANFAGEFSKIFHSLSDVNLKFSNVKNSKGKELPLSQSRYSVYVNSFDRTLRKNAFKELYKQFISYSDTIANNYIANLKADWFYAQSAKFENTLQERLFPDNIQFGVYEKLINNVNNNLKLLHRYYKLKGRALKLKDFTYYDLYVPAAQLKHKYTFEETMETLYQALAVLGSNYVELLKRSVTERWMDVYPTEGKRSGAYQSDIYGVTPIVLLNFEGLTDDVFTTAHELGHAMHSYHSNAAQPWTLAGYTIFLAEVASTVNEVLLLKYFYNKSKTKQEKIYYLEHYLQMFKGTLFRQTMFAEFEDHAHKLIEKNLPISKNVLSNFYENLNKKYQGKSVLHQKEINYEWLRIPHFYNSYYVYKYATGITSAICIASNIFNGVVGSLEKYINFLSAGGSDYSVEILKKAGVNLETDEPYHIAFAEMKWALDELEKLID